MISLNQQVEEVQRELKQRERVYPRMVAAGKMRQAIADYQMERMRAVLNTLELLRANEQPDDTWDER